MSEEADAIVNEDLVIASDVEMMGDQLLFHPDMKYLNNKPKVDVSKLSDASIKDIIIQLEAELRNREEG